MRRVELYDLVKTTFSFRLRAQVKTRLSEWQGKAEELNQSLRAETCIVIGLSFRFCFRLQQSSFH